MSRGGAEIAENFNGYEYGLKNHRHCRVRRLLLFAFGSGLSGSGNNEYHNPKNTVNGMFFSRKNAINSAGNGRLEIVAFLMVLWYIHSRREH